MGMFDMVGMDNIQIKSTPVPEMKHYDVNDKIPIDDGLWIGFEGWFVVDEGRVMKVGSNIYDKWGNRLDASTIIRGGNPFGVRRLDEIRQERLI